MRTSLNRRRPSTAGPSGGAFWRSELDALHETAVLVAERHEIPELQHRILAKAAALFAVDDGYLYLIEPDRDTLALVTGIGAFSGQVGSCVRFGEGLAGRVASGGEPLTVADHATSAGRSSGLGQTFFSTVVAAPLRGREGMLGVIGLARADPSSFAEAEVARQDCVPTRYCSSEARSLTRSGARCSVTPRLAAGSSVVPPRSAGGDAVGLPTERVLRGCDVPTARELDDRGDEEGRRGALPRKAARRRRDRRICPLIRGAFLPSSSIRL